MCDTILSLSDAPTRSMPFALVRFLPNVTSLSLMSRVLHLNYIFVQQASSLVRNLRTLVLELSHSDHTPLYPEMFTLKLVSSCAGGEFQSLEHFCMHGSGYAHRHGDYDFPVADMFPNLKTLVCHGMRPTITDVPSSLGCLIVDRYRPSPVDDVSVLRAHCESGLLDDNIDWFKSLPRNLRHLSLCFDISCLYTDEEYAHESNAMETFVDALPPGLETLILRSAGDVIFGGQWHTFFQTGIDAWSNLNEEGDLDVFFEKCIASFKGFLAKRGTHRNLVNIRFYGTLDVDDIPWLLARSEHKVPSEIAQVMWHKSTPSPTPAAGQEQNREALYDNDDHQELIDMKIPSSDRGAHLLISCLAHDGDRHIVEWLEVVERRRFQHLISRSSSFSTFDDFAYLSHLRLVASVASVVYIANRGHDELGRHFFMKTGLAPHENRSDYICFPFLETCRLVGFVLNVNGLRSMASNKLVDLTLTECILALPGANSFGSLDYRNKNGTGLENSSANLDIEAIAANDSIHGRQSRPYRGAEHRGVFLKVNLVSCASIGKCSVTKSIHLFYLNRRINSLSCANVVTNLSLAFRTLAHGQPTFDSVSMNCSTRLAKIDPDVKSFALEFST